MRLHRLRVRESDESHTFKRFVTGNVDGGECVLFEHSPHGDCIGFFATRDPRQSSIEECEENDRRDNRSTDAARNAYGFDEWVHERIPLDYGAGK